MLTFEEFNFSYEKHDDDDNSFSKKARTASDVVNVAAGATIAGGLGYVGYKTHKLIKGSNNILSEHGINDPKALHLLRRDDLGWGEKRKMKQAFKAISKKRGEAAKAGDVQRAAEYELALKRMAHLVR